MNTKKNGVVTIAASYIAVAALAVSLTTVMRVTHAADKKATPPSNPAPKLAAPVIPAELRADFYKAKSDQLQAISLMSSSQQAMQSAIQKMKSVCGKEFVPTQDPRTQEPVCVPAPRQ